LLFSFFSHRPPPTSTLFPYTTLFRSWRKVRGPGSGRSMAVNATGAVCTAVTLVVVLVSKFAEGAWVMMLLVPVLLGVFTAVHAQDRKSTRLNSSHVAISYAVFCLKKK